MRARHRLVLLAARVLLLVPTPAATLAAAGLGIWVAIRATADVAQQRTGVFDGR